MKRILIFLFLPISGALMAQEGSVGIGTQTPNEKAVLHLVAPNNDQGFMAPALTTIQRTDFSTQLTSSENGMLVYDSDLNQFFFWLTDHWEPVGSSVGSSLQAGTGIEIVDGVITNTGDADNDPANELQDLQFASGQITLSGDPDNTIIDLNSYDTDVSDDFTGDWADLANVPAGFVDGIDDIDDADNDPSNEIELPLAGDADGFTYGEFQNGDYLRALNFLSGQQAADDSNVFNNVLDISSFGFTRTLLFTPEPTLGSYITFIQVNNGVSGQELILINVGQTTLTLESYSSTSNLFLPAGFVNLVRGGSIHLVYIDDGNGFRGWVPISVSNNDAPGTAG